MITNHKYFSCLNDFKYKDISPIKKNVKFGLHIQTDLWGMENSSHIKMGLYYEELTAAIFGGTLVDSVITMKSDSPYSRCKPDVLNCKKAFESKAVKQGQQLNLLDGQTRRYRTYQIIHPDHEIYYVLWRHGFKDIKKGDKKLDELVEVLSEKTYAALVIPFTVLWSVFKCKSKKLKRYEPTALDSSRQGDVPWPDCTRWGSYDLNQWIFNPIKKISEHLIISPYRVKKRFNIERLITPSDLKFEGKQVKRIPITKVVDCYYRKSVEDIFINKVPF